MGSKKSKKSKRKTIKKKKKDKKKLNKKKKNKNKSSSSEITDDSTSSSSESDSSLSSSSDSSSDECESGVQGIVKVDPWKLVKRHYPPDKRPKELSNKKLVRSMNLQELNEITDFFAKAEKLNKISNIETLSKDVKPRKIKFKASYDDSSKKLHPARFQRFPISQPDTWFGASMPKKRQDSFKALPLDFIGCERKVSTKVISWCHDRTHVLELKHFSSANKAISSKPMKEFRRQDEDGAVTLCDLAWETPDSVNKFREAVDNFIGIYYFLWPYDPTGISMARLLNTYDYCSSVENHNKRISILKNWFNDALRINAERAINDCCIQSYQELEALLKQSMTSNGIRPELPLFRNNDFGSYNTSYQQRGRRNNQGYRQQQPHQQQQQPAQQHNASQQLSHGRNQRGPQKMFANVGGVSTCRFYNDETGKVCRNLQTARGCSVPAQNGGGTKEFLHLCNKFNSARQTYCLAAHRRKDHR